LIDEYRQFERIHNINGIKVFKKRKYSKSALGSLKNARLGFASFIEWQCLSGSHFFSKTKFSSEERLKASDYEEYRIDVGTSA
jgi:hypothetical protein